MVRSTQVVCELYMYTRMTTVILSLSPSLLPLSGCRYVFDSPQRCRTWQDRLTEGLRHMLDLKSTFAFVHRSYYMDHKIKQQERGRGEGGGGGDDFDALEQSLISLKGT